MQIFAAGEESNPLKRVGAIASVAFSKVKNLVVYECQSKVQKLANKTRLKLFRYYLDKNLPLPRFLRDISIRTVYEFAEAEYRPQGIFEGELLLFRATEGEDADGIQTKGAEREGEREREREREKERSAAPVHAPGSITAGDEPQGRAVGAQALSPPRHRQAWPHELGLLAPALRRRHGVPCAAQQEAQARLQPGQRVCEQLLGGSAAIGSPHRVPNPNQSQGSDAVQGDGVSDGRSAGAGRVGRGPRNRAAVDARAHLARADRAAVAADGDQVCAQARAPGDGQLAERRKHTYGSMWF